MKDCYTGTPVNEKLRSIAALLTGHHKYGKTRAAKVGLEFQNGTKSTSVFTS